MRTTSWICLPALVILLTSCHNDTPAPTSTASPTSTHTPTAIPTPIPTATLTAVPSPTSTPVPSPTPIPSLGVSLDDIRSEIPLFDYYLDIDEIPPHVATRLALVHDLAKPFTAATKMPDFTHRTKESVDLLLIRPPQNFTEATVLFAADDLAGQHHLYVVLILAGSQLGLPMP